MLADALAETHPDIVVGRVNCEQQEYFCAHVIKISRTPSFKVGLRACYHMTLDWLGCGVRELGVAPLYASCVNTESASSQSIHHPKL